MTGAEEIRELKKALRILERRMEKIEKGQRPTVVMLFEEMDEIMGGIVSVQEKGKAMSNLAISPRIKLAKKGIVLGKELIRFEMGLVSEFESHNISEDVEKRFISIIKLIRDNKMPAAEEELRYFGDIAALHKEHEMAKEEISRKDQALRKEQLRIEGILEEMAGLEKGANDPEKARRYEELLESLERLKGLRAAYIQSLLAKPVAELLGEATDHPLGEYCSGFREKEKMAELRQFLSDYPVFGKCSASQICELFGSSEKKLSHVCPEVSRFKKAVLGNRDLFETVGSLEQTAFIAVDDGNEETLDFYASNVDGAKDAVERIRQLKKEKDSNREEYEKGRLIGKRREELAKYSKTELENELKAVRNLQDLLHSDNLEENAGEGRGPLPGIGAFIKKLIGD
jgi:hypothetical protein